MASEIFRGWPWILPRKLALTESVPDKLKNTDQIEHSHHRNTFDFQVNFLAGLVVYTYQHKKPSLDLEFKDWQTRRNTIF